MQRKHCFFHKPSDTTSSLQMTLYYKKARFSHSISPLQHLPHNISKSLLHSCDTLLHSPPMAASPKTVLPIVTPYSLEGRYFSQSVQNHSLIIENDPQGHKDNVPQGQPSTFLPRQTNISKFCPQRIPPMIATGTFWTHMQPYPS